MNSTTACPSFAACSTAVAIPTTARTEARTTNVDVAKNKTVFPPYGIKQLGGEKIAFIGMTLKDTPSVTIPSSVAGLTFDDEVATVNALLPEIRKEGVSAIVVLLHQGDIPTAGTLYDGCGVAGGVGSFIVDIATKLDPAVDVVLSAHSHQAYNCTIAGKLVTSASSFGRVVTQVDLTIDSAQHRVTDKTAKNHAVTQDIAPDPAVQSIVASYTERAKDRANRVVGHLTGPLPRQVNASGPPEEWVLGDTIADAMLAATKKPGYDAVVAFMNPGGIRADVTCDGCSVAKPGAVTYTQAFTTQPFGNYLVTMTLTGANIRDILQQQFTSSPPKILQVSKGFTYTYTGTTVDFASIKINGVPISANATYRVTTNNFVATGGDGFTVFTKGTASKDGDIDIDAFTKYLTANDPLTPPPVNRITRR